MKKKTLSAIIAFSMAAAALAGCGNNNENQNEASIKEDLSVTEVAKGAADALDSAESISSQLTVDLSSSFTYEDQTSDMSMVLDCGIESVTDPVSAHMTETLKMSYLEESSDQTIEFYVVPEDGKQYVYTGSGDTWTKAEASASEANDTTGTIFNEIADGNIEADLADELETLDNGRSAYVLNMSVAGDYLSQMIDFNFSGDTGIFGDIDYSGMQMDTTAYVYADTLEPARLEISCGEMGEAMFEQMFGYAGVDYTVNNYSITCAYNEFNSISEITVPEEVKSAAGGSQDTSDTSAESDSSETGETSSNGDSIGADTASVEAAIENAPEIIYSSASGELDFEPSISIDDSEYVLPASYSALIDNGWTVNESADGIVYAGDYDLEYMHKGDASITAYIYNPGSSDAEYSACEIIGINVLNSESADSNISISSGIALSESTLSDVLEAYGKPSTYFVDESMIYLGYMSDDMMHIVSLYFDPASHVLNEIDIQEHPATDQGLSA